MSTEEMLKGKTVVQVVEKLDTNGDIDELQIHLDDGSIVVIRELGKLL